MQALEVDSSSYTNNAQENTRNIHGNHTMDGHTKEYAAITRCHAVQRPLKLNI